MHYGVYVNVDVTELHYIEIDSDEKLTGSELAKRAFEGVERDGGWCLQKFYNDYDEDTLEVEEGELKEEEDAKNAL